MRRSVREIFKTNLAVILAVPLTVVAIVSFNMLELLEKYHPWLVRNIYFTLAAIVLFLAFVLIGRFIHDMRADDESSDDLWPKQPH